MSAVIVANNRRPQTMGELLEYLQELKAAWTEEDAQYLGKFEDQALYLETESGVSQAVSGYYAEFGLVIWSE